MASEEPKNVRKRKITVRSSDGVEFVVKEAVAMQSETIRCMIEDGCVENGVPLHNVDGKTLAKVIKYCKKRVKSKETVKTWEAKFIKRVNNGMLFDLMQAANYLDIRGLLDLTCQTVADLCKGKMPEEIRKIFDIENDFTPEEEEEIRRENIWAFI